jgi:hypothetical protein
MPKRFSVRAHIVREATGDANDVLRYPTEGEVPTNRRHHVTLLSWKDVEHDWTQTEIRVTDGEDVQGVVTDSNKTKATVYYWPYEIVLSEGQRLEVYFSGATDGDMLHMYVQAYYVDQPFYLGG